MTSPHTVWSVLRGEGLRATLDRSLDRLAEARRARSFVPAPDDAPPFGAAELHVLPTPLSQRLGGVQGQLQRRLDALSEQGPTALLARDAGFFRLELAAPGRRLVHRLAGDQAFSTVLDRARSLAGARRLQLEGLAGYTLDDLRTLVEQQGPQVVAVHDFSAFCRRPHLLEHAAIERFCHYSRDEARCLSCLRKDWPDVGEDFQAQYRATTAALLERASRVVYPSDFLRRMFSTLFPGLTPERQRVIPPASEPPVGPRRDHTGETRVLRHAAYVGSVRVDKGGLVLAEAAEQLAARGVPLRLSILGAGDAELLARLRALPNVRVFGYYRQGRLPNWLDRLGIELALLLSIVPESYSLTFDESSTAGVPALAFDLGALGERVATAGGIVLPLNGSPAVTLARTLEELASGERPMPCRPSAPQVMTPQAAAKAWAALHHELD